MNWWERGEWSDTRGDYQAPPDFNNSAGADLLGDANATAEMFDTPLGEPPSQFDVRCIYDSRPINAYDFNFSAALEQPSGASWTVEFSVPNGYRAIPRKWSIHFDVPPIGASKNSIATIMQNGAALPNNQGIIIGMGTDNPIETFFLCEENTTFGITGANANANTGLDLVVSVYGNLIPVTDVALPLAASNQKKSGQVGVN